MPRPSLKSAQINFENRFSCMICLSPRLRMVFGLCQHKICDECLYNHSGSRKRGLGKCPSCQMEDAFPISRPDIPEDNIELQIQLGVRACPNSGCCVEMWEWEVKDHLRVCPCKANTPQSKATLKRKSSQSSKCDKNSLLEKDKPKRRRSSRILT
ncbi:uncharacterized protein LOC141914939 [Tubulanus polymorphus]|uniref:uncharacterized protein LOC141914939 n=1 Tax=Tubulanus polymorphus TaxID=672921 RepID=UPI003DA3C1D2